MFTSLFNELRSFYAARGEPENMRPMAEVYWRILISAGLLMVVAVVFYGAWEFFGVIGNLSSGDASGSSASAAALNRAQLQNVLAAVHQRDLEFQSPQTVPTPDPSK